MNAIGSASIFLAILFSFPAQKQVADPPAKLPIPEKLVVLTFDDAAKSHATQAGPLLKELGFGATFFVTEGFDFPTNKKDYMTWEEIAGLHKLGFEIGNHTIDHGPATAPDLAGRIRALNKEITEHGIPKPMTFAYPGNAISPAALAVLKAEGIRFARRGGSPEYAYDSGKGIGYEPYLDHPLLIPSAGDSRPTWTLDNLKTAVSLARSGRIAVLQFHGVPDTAHSWVNTPFERFEEMMRWLKKEGFSCIAMRDLEKYVDPQITPTDPQFPINDRIARIKEGKSLEEPRPLKNNSDRIRWQAVMQMHEFTPAEYRLATGESQPEKRLESAPSRTDSWIMPYPGGRHPRTGFRDGAIRPQRETKLSFFTPWQDGGYAVLDLPEALWLGEGRDRKLGYLAHTHVPTIWDLQKTPLVPLEWKEEDDRISMERKLPNGISFAATASGRKNPTESLQGADLQLTLANGSDQPLANASAQVCLMLANLKGFKAQSNDNKSFASPYTLAVDETGKRYVLLAFEGCQRAWGNAPCPCLHSDPAFGSLAPGQSRTLKGFIGFGTDPALLKKMASESLSRTNP